MIKFYHVLNIANYINDSDKNNVINANANKGILKQEYNGNNIV